MTRIDIAAFEAALRGRRSQLKRCHEQFLSRNRRALSLTPFRTETISHFTRHPSHGLGQPAELHPATQVSDTLHGGCGELCEPHRSRVG